MIDQHDEVPPTLGEFARRLGVPLHSAQYAMRRDRIELPRAGTLRLVPKALASRVRESFRKRGYLAAENAEAQSDG